MLTIFIIAKAFNKNSNNYNILAFTAFCLLSYNPFFIWDVGFQLSFIAVFGLIYLQPKIYKWIYVKNKWLDKLWSAVALSLAAQLATFPLSVYYFHQFPMYFLLGNLFILLPLIAMMYLGIAILFKFYFLAPLFEWIITFTNNGLKWIADLPFSGITAIWINEWQLITLTIALSLLIYALVNYHKKLLITAICLLIVFQSYSIYDKVSALKQTKIVFFSLRKNYAAAFIDAKKAILITDLVPEDKNFKFFIKPGLDKMQVDDIVFIKWKQDTIVNSFVKKEQQVIFHQYHILMMDSIFNDVKIENLPKFNAVWLHQNPNKSVSALRKEIIFSTLFIDASNKDYKIKIYEAEANKFAVQHYTFKKNAAFLINLK
jgi:competence protein ComEC